MNITTENVDELNAVLKIKVEKKDYDERVNKVLKDYRKTAKIDGFRPGMVPAGLISKMYRKPVLVDEVNKIVAESISQHLKENEINILGEPLPSETEKSNVDFDNSEEYELAFDIGLAPDFDVTVTAKDKVPYYKIKVDKKTIDQNIENLCTRFGELKEVEKVTNETIIKGNFAELDGSGNVLEGGITADESTISMKIIKDDNIKKQLAGHKVNDVVSFNLRKAFPNNTEISGILKLQDSEKAKDVNSDFQLSITSVSVHEAAKADQDLYDKIFGKDTVKGDEEFRKKISEELVANYEKDSWYRFSIDVKEAMVKKAKFELPVTFLKRWFFLSNEGKYTQEQIDEDFTNYETDIKWQLIREKFIKENDIKLEPDELLEFAKGTAQMQFAQYGMANVPEEHLMQYANQMLENKDEKRKIAENIMQEKVLQLIKEKVKLDEKDISLEKFNKLFEK